MLGIQPGPLERIVSALNRLPGPLFIFEAGASLTHPRAHPLALPANPRVTPVPASPVLVSKHARTQVLVLVQLFSVGDWCGQFLVHIFGENLYP